MKPPRWPKRKCSDCVYIGRDGDKDVWVCIGTPDKIFAKMDEGNEQSLDPSEIIRYKNSLAKPYFDNNKLNTLYYATIKIRSGLSPERYQ